MINETNIKNELIDQENVTNQTLNDFKSATFIVSVIFNLAIFAFWLSLSAGLTTS